MSYKPTLIKSLVLASVIGTAFIVYADQTVDTNKPIEANKPTETVSSVASSDQWSKPNDKKIRNMLTDEQFKVTQHDGTERPFKNKYWNNKKEGIYVDIVSGEPLFSSKDKFKSGTGWPSFTQPIVKKHVIEKTDWNWGIRRTEVRSLNADSHLGHVFNDGPKVTGLRYCINSVSLRFIPKENLSKNGYDDFIAQFK